MSANEILRKVVEKLAVCRKELEEERIAKESIRESYKTVTKVAKDMIDEERELREKAVKERDRAEYDRDYYAKELEGERRLRLHAEYVKEYYEMQIVQHGLNDMTVD